MSDNFPFLSINSNGGNIGRIRWMNSKGVTFGGVKWNRMWPVLDLLGTWDWTDPWTDRAYWSPHRLPERDLVKLTSVSAPTPFVDRGYWTLLAQRKPVPGTICDWFFIKDGYISHGRGEWQVIHNGIASDVFSQNVPIRVSGFSSAKGLAVFDPNFLHWREAQQ